MTVTEHLNNRHFDTNLHVYWENAEENVATFPLWNLSGQLKGYQRYRPDGDKKAFNNPLLGKYFTKATRDTVCVWGLESWNLSNTLFLTEGVFDACRLTKNSCSAVALLTSDPHPSTKRWLAIVRSMRPVVAVCDNDKAGLKLAKHGHTSHVVSNGDLGDASEDYVQQVIKEFRCLY